MTISIMKTKPTPAARPVSKPKSEHDWLVWEDLHCLTGNRLRYPPPLPATKAARRLKLAAPAPAG